MLRNHVTCSRRWRRWRRQSCRRWPWRSWWRWQRCSSREEARGFQRQARRRDGGVHEIQKLKTLLCCVLYVHTRLCWLILNRNHFLNTPWHQLKLLTFAVILNQYFGEPDQPVVWIMLHFKPILLSKRHLLCSGPCEVESNCIIEFFDKLLISFSS